MAACLGLPLGDIRVAAPKLSKRQRPPRANTFRHSDVRRCSCHRRANRCQTRTFRLRERAVLAERRNAGATTSIRSVWGNPAPQVKRHPLQVFGLSPRRRLPALAAEPSDLGGSETATNDLADLTARLYLFTRCPADLCFARLLSHYIRSTNTLHKSEPSCLLSAIRRQSAATTAPPHHSQASSPSRAP